MSGRVKGWLTAGVAVVLVSAVGLATEPASAQERDERERVEERQERQERADRERWERQRDRAERDRRMRGFAMMRPFGVTGGWLGVAISEVDAEAVDRLSLPEERGARVTDVREDSPAAEAGLREDDVIVRWNEQRVESAAQVSRLARETPAGRTVRLGVIRDGGERTVEVELGEARARRTMMLGPRQQAEMRRLMERARERAGDAERRMERVRVMSGRGGRLGVGLQSLTAQLGAYFGLDDRSGALVTSVREDSPAERAGLRAGDVIISVADTEVSDPMDVFQALRGREAGPVEVRVIRDRQERTLTVELEEADAGGEGALFFPGFRFDLPALGFELPAIDFEWEGLNIGPLELPSIEVPEIRIDLPPVEVPAPSVREVQA